MNDEASRAAGIEDMSPEEFDALLEALAEDLDRHFAGEGAGGLERGRLPQWKQRADCGD